MNIIPFTPKRFLPGFSARPAVTKQPVKPLDQLFGSEIREQRSAAKESSFPITLIGDSDHPAKQAQLIARLTRQIPSSSSATLCDLSASADPSSPSTTETQQKFLAMQDGYQPGAIIDSSWGYDQTNIDFYRIEKRSGLMLTLAPLQSELTETHFMSGTRLPTATPKDYATDHDAAWDNKDLQNPKPTFRRKLRMGKDGNPTGLCIAHGWASLWDGKPVSCSWYA